MDVTPTCYRVAAAPRFAREEEGIRTVWLALAALGVTAALQIAIVLWSGSVALLADTMHNVGDALNSLPLLVAFYLARRRPTRRYTYGFGRAEDVAGIFIVLSIAVSAGVIFYESFRKLLDPEPMRNVGWVAAAGVIGFLGNEAVALLQVNTGKRIGSAAMVADGQHARTDGFTSLAVVVAAGATWLGFPLVDPIIGILIGVAILFITWDATKQMWYRLMDAVDPAADARFGVVFSSLMMHHLPHDLKRQGLAEIRRVLQPGGRLVIVDVKRPTTARARLRAAIFMHGALSEGVQNLADVLREEGFTSIRNGAMPLGMLGSIIGSTPPMSEGA